MTAAWFVRGNDPLLRDRALDALVEELLGDDDRTLAVEEFAVPPKTSRSGDGDGDASAGGAEAREAVVGAALSAATSPPFMTACRVIVVRDASALAAADVEAVARYLEAPLESTRLVLVAGGAPTVPAHVTKMVKAAGVIERAPDSEKTKEVLLDHAHEAGVLLTKDAAELIERHLADDAGRAVGLVDVLASAGEHGARLDVGDVTPYLGDEGSVPVYQLTNAIEEGDSARALEVLHRLLTATSAQQPKPVHPLQLMGTLLNHYRRVLRLDDPSITSTSDAIEALGGRIKEFPARKALGAARALGTDGLREAFDALARADLDLKGARGIPQEAVMEVLVVRLARLSARTGAAGRSGGKGSGSRGSGSRRR